MNGTKKVEERSLGSYYDLYIPTSFDPENQVTLYLGDCLEFLATLPDESVQLVITSPPYNIGKEYEDALDIEQYKAQQRAIIEECIRVLKPEGSICWQVGNYVNKGEIIPLDILLYDCFKNKGLKLRNRIIWYFGHGLHCKNRFSGRYETIMWFTKSNDYIFNLNEVRVPQKYPGKRHFKGDKQGELSGNPLGKNPSDVWEIPNVKANHVEKTDHPCQFPVSLVQRLVLSMSNEGDMVLDPFMGAGSTAVAALLSQRRAAGAELVERYHQIAQERIRQAIAGDIKVRADKPVYEPPAESKLTTNLWKTEEQLPLVDFITTD
ncbi:MAG: site-specific DNA-methyltransferase [Ardenticatenales bacterium]|nr:site-specific DNA-methyltransferase [Ardenticatenales bacterium]